MPLKVSDGMGAWISDFKKSDAPQFKGKSDKERREMAIAAYMDAKKGPKNEGNDQPPFTPDPPKKDMKKNSDGTATSPMSRARQLAKMARDRNMKKEATVDTANIASKKAMKKSDTEKLGKLADMLAKERKPQKESVELEEALHPDHVTLHPHKTDKRKYTVGQVGRNVKGRLNPGEHVSDSEVDDLHDMGMKVKHERRPYRESVEIDEAKDMYKSAATELKTYADKSGGMDKKDFHTAAKHIENIGRANIMNKGQHLAQLSKHLRGLDTSPREKVLSVLHNHGHKVGDFMPGAKMRRESVQENKVKLKGFGPDAAKGNMGNPAARAALGKRMKDNEKARQALKDPDHNPSWANSKSKVEEAGSLERYKMIKKAGDKYNKEKKKAERDAMKAMSKDKDMMGEESDNFEKNFTKRIGATVRGGAGAQYLKKKAKEYQDQNKKLDPGAAKKGLGIGVTDSQKAYQKAKKKGVKWPSGGVRTSPNTRKPKRLPEGKIEEAAQFKVDIEGLPPTFMQGKSSAEILAKLRKIVKQPSMIRDVERHTDMEVKKAYRQRAQGRDMDEAVDPTDTGGAEETKMAMKQIKVMRHFLDGIEQRVSSQGDMEEWYQNKLTKANDYLKSLYAYGKGDEEV